MGTSGYRRIATAAGFVLAVAALGIWRFGPSTTRYLPALDLPQAGEGRPAGPARAKRIVLITIDTLRRDHLGTYGYPRRTSPFIDRLAELGVRFDSAFSASATTVPAHASIFTGLYPLQHGARKNGRVLSDDFATLAELLAREGYLTAAFVSTRAHFRPSNLDQGFREFDDLPDRLLSALLPSFVERRVAGHLRYRAGGRTVRRAAEWLGTLSSADRFFLWVHLFDPHRPYYWRQRFPSDAAERAVLLDHLRSRHRIPVDFFPGGEGEILELMDRYDGEVLAADQAVRELFEPLLELGLEEEAVVVLTADHGEGLGNHRWMGHGKNIYNEQLNVPLVFYGPGLIGSREVADPVQQIDLFPTILELAGVSADVVPHEGRSLLGLLKGRSEARRFAFSERQEFTLREAGKGSPREDDQVEAGEKYALQDGRFKYLHHTEGEDELYRIDRDPYELEDLVGRGLDEESLLLQQLLALVSRLEVDRPAAETAVDAEARRDLEALGYIQ